MIGARGAETGFLQRTVRARRQYNQWVANQTLEDFALRFTAEKARRWSSFQVCNTALGGVSFLACEAIGGVITVAYGFDNALAAILVVGLLTFLTSLPIAYHAARAGVDMDLLTRGAGFGYIGSTITSLIYASFTFILFAVEGTILSQALEMCLGIPLAAGHVISALLVLPIAAFGIRFISRFQLWTQPVWLILQMAPLAYLLVIGRGDVSGWMNFQGAGGRPEGFDLLSFGLAAAVLLSFLPQIGEQVDYLRFLPKKRGAGSFSWWAALIVAGPGWIVIGSGKIVAGSFLAYVALQHGASLKTAVEPSALYLIAFTDIFKSPGAALALTGLFIVTCQAKINVTNAYAGSIAWSNFFSRLTHSHPGRVVWLVFNVLLALLLMEVGVFQIIDSVLGLYANFAVAWIGALTADLVVNKPLGLSPPSIEFRRAYLHDVNPVGIGTMAVSLAISSSAMFGIFGELPRALAPFLGFAAAFTLAPLIAWATKGRYYQARPVADLSAQPHPLRCTICENCFEAPDMAHCPAYGGSICSLCCSLEKRCRDRCKPVKKLLWPFGLLPPAIRQALSNSQLGHFLKVFAILSLSSAAFLTLIDMRFAAVDGSDPATVRVTLEIVFVGMLVIIGLSSWAWVLVQESRRLAEEETESQTALLIEEIRAHERTDAALKKAKEAAEGANQAKTRFIAGLNHEIRTLLNSINGYAQLLENKSAKHPEDAVHVIRNSSEHVTRLMDELLDISRIEAGTMQIYRNVVPLHEFLDKAVDMVRLQAAAKGIEFRYRKDPQLPLYVFADEKRLRQILLNLLTNAIKYTERGYASLEVHYRSMIAEFVVSDSGIGIPSEDLERVFEPFERGRSPGAAAVAGTGLGLTIARLLVRILGGDLSVESSVGKGSKFKVRLMLPEASPKFTRKSSSSERVIGYAGKRRSIVIADDDFNSLELMRQILSPLGFQVFTASNGGDCLELVEKRRPDLVILDISMPGMNGWDVAKSVRAAGHGEMAILMVSAEFLQLSAPHRREKAHDDYLVKPIEISQLLDRIQTLLEIKWITESLEKVP